MEVPNITVAENKWCYTGTGSTTWKKRGFYAGTFFSIEDKVRTRGKDLRRVVRGKIVKLEDDESS
jgi:hypothetical protein